MFTRLVEMTSKSGKSQELATTINEKAIPILKKQRGLAEEVVLVSSGKPARVLALSFWNKKEDADQYQREQYQKIHDTLWLLLETEPTIRTFDVHTTIAHKVTAKQAA